VSCLLIKCCSGALLHLVVRLFMFLLIFNEQRVLKFTFVLVLTYYVNHSLKGAPHLFVILTAIGWFIVNIQSDLFWHRCLERQTFGTPRMYTLSPSKIIKRSNYGEFLKDKNVLLLYTTVLSAYKYAPNLESLLTKQYVCVMCTLWSDNTCVFTRFYSVKNVNTQLIWSSVQILKLIMWLISKSCPPFIKLGKAANSLSFLIYYTSVD
jgi:hypothetical protein